jgi:hypothetical protein
MRLEASKGESVALKYSPWGWVWIGISLVLVAAVAALWAFWPPKCRGSVLCVGGPPAAERVERVPSGTREQDRAQGRVFEPSGSHAPYLSVEPRTTTGLPRPNAPSALPTARPAGNGQDRAEAVRGSDSSKPDKVYGWEKHGKPAPPGHGGEPPGQART